MTTFELWASKVVVTDACWLWSASKSSNGYGYFQNKKAHRVAYELFKGDVPKGLHLDHLCRVRHCVNPNHLEPVSCRENIRRGIKGLKGNGWAPCPHGFAARRKCKDCHAERMRLWRKSKAA